MFLLFPSFLLSFGVVIYMMVIGRTTKSDVPVFSRRRLTGLTLLLLLLLFISHGYSPQRDSTVLSFFFAAGKRVEVRIGFNVRVGGGR